MSTIIRVLVWGLGALLVLGLGAFFYISNASFPNYQEKFPVADRPVSQDSTIVAHGRKLTVQICAGCHKEDQATFAGRAFEDKTANEAFGEIYVSNLTRHPEHGINDYTSGELYRLLRTGVKRDGQLCLPVMPRWPTMADSDLDAIIAFLKSDDPLLAATDKPNQPYEPTLLSRALHNFAFAPIPPQDYPEKPPVADGSIAHGAYLLNDTYGCYLCHSKNLEEWDLLEPTNTPNYLRGGSTFAMPTYTVTAPSIVPDSTSEIANWTQDEFLAAILHDQRPGKPAYRKPMHAYPYLDTTEVRAIYEYLQDYAK